MTDETLDVVLRADFVDFIRRLDPSPSHVRERSVKIYQAPKAMLTAITDQSDLALALLAVSHLR